MVRCCGLCGVLHEMLHEVLCEVLHGMVCEVVHDQALMVEVAGGEG